MNELISEQLSLTVETNYTICWVLILSPAINSYHPDDYNDNPPPAINSMCGTLTSSLVDLYWCTNFNHFTCCSCEWSCRGRAWIKNSLDASSPSSPPSPTSPIPSLIIGFIWIFALLGKGLLQQHSPHSSSAWSSEPVSQCNGPVNQSSNISRDGHLLAGDDTGGQCWYIFVYVSCMLQTWLFVFG